MTESLNSPSDKIGLPPGSLVHVGEAKQHQTVIKVIAYNRERVDELPVVSPDEIFECSTHDTIKWVMIEGVSDAEQIGRIGAQTNIHPLVLEDILTSHQRPKFEEYEDYLYIVINGLIPENGDDDLESEQVSLLIFKDSVFVFREKTDPLLHPVLNRIRAGRGRIRSMGPDYLAYTIIDIIVDNFFVLTESIEDEMNLLEESLLSSEPLPDTPARIQKLKGELIFIKKHISPVKELVTGMLRSDSELIQEKTKLYLRDVFDHVMRASDAVESYRETLSGLLAVYMSGLSNKMNEIMKVLTLFASVFIPLTFIAGIYGMNFEYMPELKMKWAYPLLWIAFIVIPVCLVLFFRKKKWL